MREILFRGKNAITGEWIYGDLIHCDTGIHMSGENADFVLVKEKTIGQFTGLYDKNGKEIFEGDIVEAKLTNGNYQGFSWGLQLVSFQNGAFGLITDKKEFTPLINYNYNVEFEIMGNIYNKH